jgi:hypothetical protein
MITVSRINYIIVIVNEQRPNLLLDIFCRGAVTQAGSAFGHTLKLNVDTSTFISSSQFLDDWLTELTVNDKSFL